MLEAVINESLLEQIVKLEPTERLELIEAVWDSLSPEDLPLTEAERTLLDARLTDMELHPDEQSSWADVKSRLDRLLP